MPFFYSISLFCSVMGSTDSMGTTFMDIWTQSAGLWVRSDGVFCGLGEHLARLGSGKSLSCSFHAVGGLGPPQLRLCAVPLEWQLQMETRNVGVSTDKSAAKKWWGFSMTWKSTSVPNQGTVQKRSVGSLSTFKEPCWRKRTMLLGHVGLCSIPSFPTMSELHHPLAN